MTFVLTRLDTDKSISNVLSISNRKKINNLKIMSFFKKSLKTFTQQNKL